MKEIGPISTKKVADFAPSTESPSDVKVSATAITNQKERKKVEMISQVEESNIGKMGNQKISSIEEPVLIDVEASDIAQIELVEDDWGRAIPEFAKFSEEIGVNKAVKVAKLKETIQEVIQIVDSSINEMNKLSPESLKSALQLVYQLRQFEKEDISGADPAEVRKLANLAAAIKSNKDMIVIQKEKLKTLKTRLNERALVALDAKLELIAKIFDDFLRDLEDQIRELVKKGEKLITYAGKKGGKDFRVRERIKKEQKNLSKQVEILKRIANLPTDKFNQVKIWYLDFVKARAKRQNKLVKEYSEKIASILNLNRMEFLNETKDKKLAESLKEIFQID